MDDVQEALDKFRDEFLRSSRERLDAMAALLDRVRQDPSTPDLLEGLARHFHGLAGSGGIYGFERVSRLAGEGELDCQGVLDGKGTATSGQMDRWRGLIEDIRLSLAAGEPPTDSPNRAR